MSVSLTPSSSLGFTRPLTQTVKRTLSVTNNNDEPVAFKVKTTAPKVYCVRPNSGRIEPRESVEVIVLLQALKEEPPLNAKCKDKFLVQSTIISPDKEDISLHDLWASLDGTDTTVHQQKIRVTYLPPVGQPVEEEDEGINQSSMMGGDSRFETIRESAIPNGHTAEPVLNTFDDHPILSDIQPPVDRAMSPGEFSAAQEEMEPQPQILGLEPLVDIMDHHHVVAAPPPPVPQPMIQPMPQPIYQPDLELRRQLADAQDEIERLRTLLASMPDPNAPGLRQRTRGNLSDDEDGTVISGSGRTEVETMLDQTLVQPPGVPTEVVIMIALGVFVTTYLFF